MLTWHAGGSDTQLRFPWRPLYAISFYSQLCLTRLNELNLQKHRISNHCHRSSPLLSSLSSLTLRSLNKSLFSLHSLRTKVSFFIFRNKSARSDCYIFNYLVSDPSRTQRVTTKLVKSLKESILFLYNAIYTDVLFSFACRRRYCYRHRLLVVIFNNFLLSLSPFYEMERDVFVTFGRVFYVNS